MKKNTKRAMALVLGMAMAAGTSMAAFAADDTPGLDDILSIDGKTGKIYLEADDEGYNYPLKFLYDTNFWYRQDSNYPDPTLGRVIDFLGTGRQEGFSTRSDVNAFVNSALGEKTAEIWYPHMMYEDQMDPGLLAYWETLGLKKEAYWADETGLEQDYFVYTPTKAEQPEEGYPMVLLFHGGGEVAYQAETFGFCEVAVEEGIILVAMEKTGDKTTAIQDAVVANYPVDTSRIYAVGSSGGGSNAMQYSMTNIDTIAAAGIMDQPVSLNNRWFEVDDETVAKMKEKNLPMVWLGGTADCYGLYGVYSEDTHSKITTEFFETSEGAEEQFISGWNKVMEAFGIEDKDITTRLEVATTEPANYAEEMAGYPFDNAENIAAEGESAIYKCTMNATDDMCLYLVENRPHMPCGFDAENIWSFISQYSRDAETGISAKAE